MNIGKVIQAIKVWTHYQKYWDAISVSISYTTLHEDTILYQLSIYTRSYKSGCC